MIRIFLFLHEFAARGFFLHRYDVIDSSSVPHEKPRIYDVDRETYLFSLSYIYFVRYNKYISTTCKYGMLGLYKLSLSYTAHVLVVLWAIADLTILIHVPGFKFVSEILICRSSKTSVSLYQRSGTKLNPKNKNHDDLFQIKYMHNINRGQYKRCCKCFYLKFVRFFFLELLVFKLICMKNKSICKNYFAFTHHKKYW